MTQIAKTYGESLYGLAHDENISEEILKQLDEVAEIFRENPKYEDLLLLPSVPKKQRCELLDESFKGSVHEYLLNFLKILVENGTIRELSGCVEAYRNRYYEDNGILAVKVVTAMPLTDELNEKLTKKLTAVTGKKIILTTKIDPSVLGGIKLEMGGNLYDGTVSTRLEEVQKILSDTVL
jgi:F-type H+-transporting ATPase subunit delta